MEIAMNKSTALTLSFMVIITMACAFLFHKVYVMEDRISNIEAAGYPAVVKGDYPALDKGNLPVLRVPYSRVRSVDGKPTHDDYRSGNCPNAGNCDD